MDAPAGIDLPEPIYEGENRTDPAKSAWNITPETEFLEATKGAKS